MTQAETKSGGIFSWYFNISILKRIVFGLTAGAVVGIILANMPAATATAYHANTRFFGDLFIRLLQMIVVPVIFFSVIAGVSAIQPVKVGTDWRQAHGALPAHDLYRSHPGHGFHQHLPARRGAQHHGRRSGPRS
jgi:hypothetical protein